MHLVWKVQIGVQFILLAPILSPNATRLMTQTQYVDCTKHHHKTLQGATSPFLASVVSTYCANSLNNSAWVLLATRSLSELQMAHYTVCFIILPHVVLSLVLKLKGKRMKLNIKAVIGSKSIDSNVFHIPLIDRNNAAHVLKVLQL